MVRAVALVLILSALGVGITVASPLTPKPEAEKWVLDQLRDGQIADLSQRGEDRVIRGEFIESLLTDDSMVASIHTRGVRIFHAQVVGPLILEYADISARVHFENCSFHDSVSFYGASAQRKLAFVSCKFQGAACFREASVRGCVRLAGSQFYGPATFSHLSVEGHLELQGTEFGRSADAVDFNTMVLSGKLLLLGAKFYRPVNFTAASIGGVLWADNAQFSDGSTVQMNLLRVGGYARFDSAVFVGPINFSSCKVGARLLFRGARFESKAKSNFEQTQCTEADFQCSTFNGEVTFDGLVTEYDLNLCWVRLEKQVYLTNISVGCELRLDSTSFGGVLNLSGTTYKRITRGGESPQLRDSCFAEILDLVNGTPFSKDVYVTLETFFSGRGYDDWADSTYIEMKRRERSHLWQVDWLSASWNKVLDISMLYGCSVRRLLSWMFFFVALGRCWFYRADEMSATNHAHSGPPYRAWWYSLDLFVPVVQLGMASRYQPRSDRSLTWFYLRVHRLLGWVFAALLVTAITGIMR